MRLHLVDRRQVRDWHFPSELFTVMEAVCEPAGHPHWNIDLILMDSAEIGRLNSHFRDVPEVTDVLSFSYLDLHGSGKPVLANGERCAGCDLWWDRIEEQISSPVGEVVLAPAYIKGRCEDNGWPFAQELALLTVHGVLHILGWQHDDRRTTAAMRAKEAELLELGDLAHPLRERG